MGGSDVKQVDVQRKRLRACELINISQGVISAGENRNVWGETLNGRDRNPSHSSTLRHLSITYTGVFRIRSFLRDDGS